MSRAAGGVPRRRLLVVGVVWAVVAAVSWSVAARHEDGVTGGVAAALAAVAASPSAPIALLLAYLIRPLTLLPVTVLTVFAGYLFGAALGFVVALAALVVTALVPYVVARVARGRRPAAPADDAVRRGLARRPFEAVLAARLAMLPGDLVSATAGVLRVPIAAFVGATAIGGAPGILAAVLAGASVQGAFTMQGVAIDVRMVAAAAVATLVGFAAAALVRRRGRAAA